MLRLPGLDSLGARAIAISLSIHLVRLSIWRRIKKTEENVSLKHQIMNDVVEVNHLELPQSFLFFILLPHGAEDKRINCYITC